jgi:hypothetical protein
MPPNWRSAVGHISKPAVWDTHIVTEPESAHRS